MVFIMTIIDNIGKAVSKFTTDVPCLVLRRTVINQDLLNVLSYTTLKRIP